MKNVKIYFEEVKIGKNSHCRCSKKSNCQTNGKLNDVVQIILGTHNSQRVGFTEVELNMIDLTEL